MNYNDRSSTRQDGWSAGTIHQTRWTSSKCAVCGSRLVPEEHRAIFCLTCKRSVDRDINAAHNILLRGTRVVPNGAASEAAMTELGNGEPVICLVDTVK
ncbi:MAG: transposase [Thaumarchaeota archaeon]|nr:transposase [Nitrososphaerota archaeon]